jgi:hypothetical protein
VVAAGGTSSRGASARCGGRRALRALSGRTEARRGLLARARRPRGSTGPRSPPRGPRGRRGRRGRGPHATPRLPGPAGRSSAAGPGSEISRPHRAGRRSGTGVPWGSAGRRGAFPRRASLGSPFPPLFPCPCRHREKMTVVFHSLATVGDPSKCGRAVSLYRLQKVPLCAII